MIARLNNGYGGGGTVPGPERYANFAQACGRWVERSIDPADQQHGCHVWIIGNEMNNPREWPGNVNGVGGQEITPQLYAQCFNQARAAIQAVQGRAIVCPGVVDPYYGPGSDNRTWFLAMLSEITALDGIGEWSANYIAMRALREPDAFPAGDLGLRRALVGDEKPMTAKALSRKAEAWRPWRAYAAVRLWTALTLRMEKR